jgi:DNA-binding NtrC family response regulator
VGGRRGRGAALPDVRVLWSSLREPAEAVEQGTLIEEAFRHLTVETLRLPALRDRAEDVGLLTQHFIDTICEINNLAPLHLAPEALVLLEGYRWPANVQELRNVVEQAVILAPEGTILPRHLPDRLRDAAPARGESAGDGRARRFREAKRAVVEGFEKSYLHDLMQRHAGNVTAASQQAGMLRSALQRLLRKYGLKSAEFRKHRRPAAAARNAARSSVE